MKKIDFKKPKYALPVIVLPFLFLFNYLYLDAFPVSAAKGEPTRHAFQETDEIITALPDANLDKKAIDNKLSAGLEKHKYTTDYSAIRELEEEGGEQQEYGSVYSDKEKRMLDSINNAILMNKQRPEFMSQVQERQNRNRYAGSTSRPRTYQKPESAYEKEMRLFKEQMRFIDSLDRAGQPGQPAKGKTTASRAVLPKKENKEEAPEALAVRKTANPNAAYFNTVRNNDQEQFIKAMLDEGLKVRDGGRIRIRLLDDIYVNDYEIEKGAYLYGTVSGFSAQRVEIKISSLLYGNQIIPVDLTLYDNDGLAGLYVPASQFRDFTKQLATNTTNGQTIDFNDNPENTNQMLYSMMDKMAQTTTRAVGKSVRQNKAKLKYNTIVYLIDNKAKKL